ncbi:MAG: DegT/DnrJ/EryC1/StrS family aminotransferase [Gemmatimonadota bacterium]|nr:DegT/DnrJ/EryC1/StrS family aminotransferase [Gemmatimonadota bacterium]
MIVPANPHAGYAAHKEEIDEAVQRVLNSGWYILGQEVKAFEDEFAAYIGVQYGIGVASGTDALQLALRTLGVAQGDEVVTTPHTAVATATAVDLCGATPVFVDIEPDSYALDPQQLEAAITERTRVIIPVHIYGHPADLDPILEIARRHGAFVLEDCSQSHGALYKQRRTGAWGDIAVFSLYPTKNLGALGDGGVVVTDRVDLADRARLMREYGWQDRYVSAFVGMNSRLDEMQAAILRVKLRYLEEENETRRVYARMYDQELEALNISRPLVSADVEHVYHQYVIRSQSRNELQIYLREHEIGSLIHYPTPIHQQPAYVARCQGQTFPACEQAAAEILSLPMYPQLTEDDIYTVANHIGQWFPD